MPYFTKLARSKIPYFTYFEVFRMPYFTKYHTNWSSHRFARGISFHFLHSSMQDKHKKQKGCIKAPFYICCIFVLFAKIGFYLEILIRMRN